LMRIALQCTNTASHPSPNQVFTDKLHLSYRSAYLPNLAPFGSGRVLLFFDVTRGAHEAERRGSGPADSISRAPIEPLVSDSCCEPGADGRD